MEEQHMTARYMNIVCSKFYTGLPEDCRLMPGCSAATLHKVQLSRDEILIDFELQTKCVFWLETYGHETYPTPG